MHFFFKIITLFFSFKILIFYSVVAIASDTDFETWLSSYKKIALKKGISQKTIDITFKDVKFLEKVIEYDRKQPEFFEDTVTYVSKRATDSRAKKAERLFKINAHLFSEVESEFMVEKEILLALWGIETQFGKYVGKMDIISSLATLSFDKRRREFFSSQLLILLKLIDKKLIDPSKLYGSWAGAYGNFQFMPSTISRYAIDYDRNNKIELKTSLEDSLASAANYISKIGWKKGEPCFYRVKLTKKMKKKYINLSAKNISNKLKISKWKRKGVINVDGTELQSNLKAALILPDGKPETPMFLVFDNYEKILKWNRSLRFGISVCTLAKMIKV
jgi:membrane-bound lytic murein transglycosylase B|tara:strand:+ start:2120 stop:3115 length:996 start_codon:yes stop_codon:yes gene_type:complete